MLTLLTLLLFVAAGSAFRANVRDPKVVKLSVYYETECNNSKRFITTDLWNDWYEIEGALKLDLVPYGRTNHSRVNDKWKFNCPHGETELLHSKLHACIIKKIHPHQTKVLKAIRCLMGKTDQVAALSECLAEIHLKPDTQKFLDCMNSPDSDNLFARYGDHTHRMFKALDSTPKIVYNDKYKGRTQEESMKNFLKVVCRYIPDHCRETLDQMRL